MILGIVASESGSATAASVLQNFVATQGQTAFVVSIIANNVDVSINNAPLTLNIGYTHVSGTNTVTLTNAAIVNDTITIRSFK